MLANELKTVIDDLLLTLQLKTIYSDNESIVLLCNNILGTNANYLRMIEDIICKMQEHSKAMHDRIQEEINKNV
jgi:hypothetical protein